MPASLPILRERLRSAPYRQDRLREDVPIPGDPTRRKAALVAYRDLPFDARTSAIAVVEGPAFDDSDIHLLRPLGAPIVVHSHEDHILIWKQTANAAEFVDRVPRGKITSFFQKHLDQLSPDALYRAKVWGRMTPEWQQSFVDAGLLPVIEKAAGDDLRGLLERAVLTTKAELKWGDDIRAADGCWLLKAVFWLLAAKILRDKEVPGFKSVKLANLEDVYARLARHYHRDDPRPVQIDGTRRRDALLAAVELIDAFGHCGAVTTESLAWVYESALIDKATRQEFGTHSTPTWLVDDIVARMRPWIEAMPVDERRVCEPACGHAGFLISAMRLLSELLPENRMAERKAYLRKRLHGIEREEFAYEVARLSLTLADVPNDNGWMLDHTDMFQGTVLREGIAKANIVLANPPYEKFGQARPLGAMHGRADETFRQIVEALPVGGVFGVVLPQTILHSTQGRDIRRRLLAEYEISEITAFADKVFNYGEPETAVILGRRVGDGKRSDTIRYRRVREEQVASYSASLQPTSEESVKLNVFEGLGGVLRMPELWSVWHQLKDHPKLSDWVSGGKGFEHKGKDDPTLPKGTVRESKVKMDGLTEGFAGWAEKQLTHELPEVIGLNLAAEAIAIKRHGTVIGNPQILLNYPRISREAWRLKALLDERGHPVTSDYTVLRPAEAQLSPKALWAVLNSPVANAFAYSHSSKRHVLVGDMRKMPFPESADFTALESAVDAYFTAAQGTRPLEKKAQQDSPRSAKQLSLVLPGEENPPALTPAEELKFLHWRIDAEVLRLYGLSETAEWQILRLFTGVRRRGVPFVQDEYFPKEFTRVMRLSDLLAITADWEHTNRRRAQLIKKDVKSSLSDKERQELAGMEDFADARLELMDIYDPPKPDEIDKVVMKLKREGKWPE